MVAWLPAVSPLSVLCHPTFPSLRHIFGSFAHALSGGPKSALGSAIACGILLGVFEGVGVLLSRVFSEGTRPQLPPCMCLFSFYDIPPKTAPQYQKTWRHNPHPPATRRYIYFILLYYPSQCIIAIQCMDTSANGKARIIVCKLEKRVIGITLWLQNSGLLAPRRL